MNPGRALKRAVLNPRVLTHQQNVRAVFIADAYGATLRALTFHYGVFSHRFPLGRKCFGQVGDF